MNRKAPYLFLLPYAVLFALFWAGPILYALRLSFINTRSWPWQWAPLVNWGRLPHDPFFWKALRNTFEILVLQVPVMLVLAVALAVALNHPGLRARPVFRFAFFAPVVVGAVPYSATFRLLFNTRFGLVNSVLHAGGLPAIDWLYQPVPAMAVLIMALTWRWTGYNAILVLSGLQGIPIDVYEAARVDGASAWRQFLAITLPSLRPVLVFCAALSVIGTLQLFTEPYLITNGGPGNATMTLGIYLYQQGFRNYNFGYASAVAYAVALLCGTFSWLQTALDARPMKNAWLYAALVPAALLWILPLWFMLVYATQPDNAIYQAGVTWWPGTDLAHNLAQLEADIHLSRALFNSVAISTLSTVLSLLLTSMAGYALARFEFKGSAAFFALVMGTLAVPYFVVVIPQYILVAAHLQLSNTWWGVLLPGLANSLGIFFMRQNFLSLPQALLDAARIDGAGEARIFFRIAMPLVRPALAALSLILFLGVWNDYLWPLLVLTDRDMQTAPVALGSLIGLTRVSWAGIMAGSLLCTLPLLVAFMLLQRQFLAGITAGGVKD